MPKADEKFVTLDPRKRTRRYWKKALYVSFFWGIMKVFLLRVKIYGPARRGVLTKTVDDVQVKKQKRAWLVKKMHYP